MKKILFLFIILFTNLFSFSQTIYGLKKTINGSLTIPFDVVSIDPNTATSNIEISTNSLVAVAAEQVHLINKIIDLYAGGMILLT